MDRQASLSVQEAGGPATPVVSAATPASYRAFGPLASLTFGTTPPLTETRTYDARYSPPKSGHYLRDIRCIVPILESGDARWKANSLVGVH
jgi:hypothetical protein